jgi:hypothetical protein
LGRGLGGRDYRSGQCTEQGVGSLGWAGAMACGEGGDEVRGDEVR